MLLALRRGHSASDVVNEILRRIFAELPPVVRADMAHLVLCVADNVPQRVDEHPPDFSTGQEDVDAIL
jgi:predicted Zn-dependent protease with MMP-like domain